MKNKFYNILTIALFYTLITGLSGCQDVVAPQIYENTKILHSESKWLINIVTKDKIFKVLYKEYDKNGKILLNEEYTEIGLIKSRSSYIYNDSLSIEKVVQFNDSGSIFVTNKNEYTFDLKGRVVKKVIFEADTLVKSVQTYNYDNNGNLIKKIDFNTQSGTSSQTDINYAYSNSGELIGRVTLFDGATQSRDSLVYNPVNHTLDIINLNDTGIINTKNTIKYNNQGRIIEQFSTDSSGNISKKYIFEYTYYN
jgi:hypothetical protein